MIKAPLASRTATYSQHGTRYVEVQRIGVLSVKIMTI
jgi:hypothetical protein